MILTERAKYQGQRLDAFLRDSLKSFSRAALIKAIKAGQCKVDGQIVSDPAFRMRPGQCVEIEMIPPDTLPAAEDGPIHVLWTDGVVAVCDKPPYLTTHPCPSCQENTLVQRLLNRFDQLAAQGGQRPGIAHRLDKDTSGLIVIALDKNARLKLAEAFASHKVEKEYLALVAGVPPFSGECTEPVGRHPDIRTKMTVLAENRGGRPARTAWRLLWQSDDGKFSLVAVRIFTGRTHQIRVHFSHMGYPLLGDGIYAPATVKEMAPRQMLHSWRLGFHHPLSDRYALFQLPPPEDFLQTILNNSRQCSLIVVTGNQGCGKSSFCRYLAEKGVPVASADAIVATLYSGQGPASDWVRRNIGSRAIKPDGGVDKKILFGALEEKISLRKAFEAYIHALVLDEINQFWQKNSDRPFCVAEIPLYFECGWDKILIPRPLAIGINCPREERWERIALNRGWSLDKISTLESWQWDERRKMQACDIIVDNTGNEADLLAQAGEILARLPEIENKKEREITSKLQDIWGETKIEIDQAKSCP